MGGGGLDVPFKLLVVGRSAPTVSGSGIWVRRVLVSGVLVGGEGGEGRGRRQRHRAGLRAEASCRRGVHRRPRDTERGGGEALLGILSSIIWY